MITRQRFELQVKFEVTSSKTAEKNVVPRQCFLMFQFKSLDVAAYIPAKAQDGKHSISTSAKYLLQQIGQHERLELSLIVGDPRFAEGVVWNLGTLKMDPNILKDSGIQHPPLPRRLHEQKTKPEIHHIFVRTLDSSHAYKAH